MCSAFHHQASTFSLDNSSRVFDYSSYAWDATWFSQLYTLYAGGCVCVPSQEDRLHDPSGAIVRLDANYLVITPTVASLLEEPALCNVRFIILGGEAPPQELIEKLRQGRHVLNSYGPSECTIAATWAEGAHLANNIGYGTGTVLWVVDTLNQDVLAPVGCVGELFIEGPLVGRGYLNNIDKTNEVFIENPRWLLEGSQGRPGRPGRVYRTGDLARYDTDGSLIFVGRRDSQVKIRGQRCELSEVESHVHRLLCPSRSSIDAEVLAEVVRHRESGREILAAFIVPKEGPSLTEDALHMLVASLINGIDQRLAESVPQYMIPSVYVPLTRAPTTSSGKRDRKALQELAASAKLENITEKDEFVAPANGSESILQELWENILVLPRGSVSARANWLLKGGDSIAAMRLSTAARRNRLKLTVADILRNPILSNMAAKASTLADHEQNSTLKETQRALSLFREVTGNRLDQLAKDAPYLCRDNIESVAPATDTQLWMLAVTELHPEAFWAKIRFEAPEGLDMEKLSLACEEVIKHNAILRTIFVQAGESLVQVVLKSAPQVQIHTRTGNNLIQASSETTGLPQFDISVTGNTCHHFQLRIHHALYDAISMGLIFSDLSAAFAGEHLTSKPDFHNWIFHSINADRSADHTYWRNLLSGSTMTYLAPPSPERAFSPSLNLSSVSIKSIRTADKTSANIFKAAWALLLSHVLNTEDVTFGEINSNRTSNFPGIDEIRGPCLTVVPVRAHVDRKATMGSVVEQLQRQSIDSTPHQGLGFRSIIKDCTSWPSTRFGSILVFQNHNSFSSTLRVGEVVCKLKGEQDVGDSADVWLSAEPGPGSLEILLTYSTQRLSEAQARWLLQSLMTILEYMPTNLNVTVGGYDGISKGLDSCAILSSFQSQTKPIINGSAGMPTKRSIEIVQQIWRELELPHFKQDEDCSMFPRGTDIVTAMLLSKAYHHHGFKVETEAIVKHPKALAQAWLLDKHAKYVN